MADDSQISGIADAHHHIWRINDLDWLKGPTQPRIFGDYSNIKKDYLISDFWWICKIVAWRSRSYSS